VKTCIRTGSNLRRASGRLDDFTRRARDTGSTGLIIALIIFLRRHGARERVGARWRKRASSTASLGLGFLGPPGQMEEDEEEMERANQEVLQMQQRMLEGACTPSILFCAEPWPPRQRLVVAPCRTNQRGQHARPSRRLVANVNGLRGQWERIAGLVEPLGVVIEERLRPAPGPERAG
jgi:hypothetical protein